MDDEKGEHDQLWDEDDDGKEGHAEGHDGRGLKWRYLSIAHLAELEMWNAKVKLSPSHRTTSDRELLFSAFFPISAETLLFTPC